MKIRAGRFAFLIMILVFLSCQRNKNTSDNLVCDENQEVCKVFIPEYSEDNVQVFTCKTSKRSILPDLLDHYHFKSLRNITRKEIIESEILLRNDTKVLNSFIGLHGKKAFTGDVSPFSGYLAFGQFQMLPIEKYKRQYVGIVDQEGNSGILVLLFYDKNEHESSHRQWTNQNFISITLTERELENVYYLFHINKDESTLKLLQW